jgi:ribosomal-protein-alanine N-acetyltransferase
MARVVIPDPSSAERLAGIARVAFNANESPWSARDFMALGGPPDAAMIVDDGFSEALLVMRMAADEAEILNFGVVPSARRKGLGRELLGAALALARQLGIKRIFLEVATDNVAARALYAGSGFTQAGRRREYYLRPDGTRTDALILSRGV